MPIVAAAVLRSGGPFDLVNGIPVHPLVVHAAVVLIPLTALGMIVMAIWPRFSARHGWLVVACGVVAAVSSVAATESGEVLEGRVGEPGYDHAELGDVMPIFAAALLVMVVVLWLIDRRAPVEGPTRRRGLRIAVAVVGVVVALANLFWVYRVGDSGAKSVWSGEVATSTPAGDADDEDDGDDDGDDEQADGSTATPAATGAAATTAIAMADLAAHSTRADCWVAIDGAVHDLTTFLDQHPGGSERIIDLCGTDGTAAFLGQHDGEQEPTAILADSQIGVLG
jgi:cytochrome b involved in lipid metabolism